MPLYKGPAKTLLGKLHAILVTHFQEDLELEQVHRKTTRKIRGLEGLSYETRLEELSCLV